MGEISPFCVFPFHFRQHAEDNDLKGFVARFSNSFYHLRPVQDLPQDIQILLTEPPAEIAFHPAVAAVLQGQRQKAGPIQRSSVQIFFEFLQALVGTVRFPHRENGGVLLLAPQRNTYNAFRVIQFSGNIRRHH